MDETRLGSTAPDATRAIEYVDSNVPFDDVLKSFIYRREDMIKDTAKEDSFAEIIRDVLLTGQGASALSSPDLTFSTLRDQLTELMNKYCSRLLESSTAEDILRPALQVLAMEMMNLPGEQNLPDFKQRNFKINSMPALVVCFKFACFRSIKTSFRLISVRSC